MSGLAAALVFCAWLPAGAAQTLQSGIAPPPRLPDASEALHAAVRAADFSRVKQLVGSGADVNAHDSMGNTPLLYAAWPGNIAISEFLLDHGADPNTRQSGPPILTLAVLAGRTEVVKLLLAHHARVDRRDPEGRTVLHLAARYGYEQIAGLLLAAHADIGAADGNGDTALDQAVLFGQSSVIPVLLQYGADPQRVHQRDGRGPVHEAAMKGSAALIDMLVVAGADPASPDLSGQTPIDLALAYKNRGTIAALEQLSLARKDCQETVDRAMESATMRGRSELARLLIEGGFNIQRPTAGGSTYLHEAALKGQIKIVQLFLERGANVNALDETGGTPLHSAALGGNAEVIRLLLNHGSAIDARDRESGATPLMLAAAVARADAVSLLLARGADPALRDRAGRTALDRARQTEDSQTVKLLEAVRSHSAAPSKTAVS